MRSARARRRWAEGGKKLDGIVGAEKRKEKSMLRIEEPELTRRE